jgi:hypothetical protein
MARWQPIGGALMSRWRRLRAPQGGADHRAKTVKLKARSLPQTREQYCDHGIHVGVVELGDRKQVA